MTDLERGDMAGGAWEGEVDVTRAIEAIASGAAAVVIDEEAAPAQGALVIAPDAMTDAWMESFVRHTTGIVRVTATERRLRSLGIAGPEASIALSEGPPPASARGRAATIRALGRAGAGPEGFTRPGYVLVVHAQEPGVLGEPALPEAAADLARLADRGPTAAFAEIVNGPAGDLADAGECRATAEELGLPVVTVADLVRHGLEQAPLVERVTETTLPTRVGVFHCVAYRSAVDAGEHLALVAGDVSGEEPVLARVQRSFPLDEILVTGDRDRSQLERSMARMAAEGRGVLVYLRPYPDIGVGLVSELEDRAVRLEAQSDHPFLGFDERQHGIGAQILRDLGLRRLRLLTDHPRRHRGLRGFGLEVVEYVPLSEPGTGGTESDGG